MPVRPRITHQRMLTAQWNLAGLCGLMLAVFLCAVPRDAHAQTKARYTYADSMKVAAIEINGDSAIRRGTLLEHMSTRETPSAFAAFLFSITERLPFAAEPQYFDFFTYQGDLDALRFFYQNNGFLNARVEGRYDTLPGRRAVRVTIDVQEGRASFIDSIAYKNIDRLAEDVRDAVLRTPVILPGQQYSADNVRDEIARVTTLLGNMGYPLASIGEIVVERRLSDNNMFIPVPINPGRRLRFGTIRDSVIGEQELNLSHRILYGRLDFKEGDFYSNEKREKSEQNLSRLGFFSTVKVMPQFPRPSDTLTSVVPMTLALAPRKQNDLDPGININDALSRLNLGASLSYILRNPWGSGWTVTAGANVLAKVDWPVEDYQMTAQLRIDQPYFMRSDISLSLAIAGILAKETKSYKGNIVQFVPSLQWRLTERLRWNIDWTLERAQFDEIFSSLSLSPLGAIDTLGIPYINSILSTSLEYDRTNDIYNPTNGYAVRGTLEEAGVLTSLLRELDHTRLAGYQSTQYVKTEGLLRAFSDISRNNTSILAMKFRIGGTFRYGQNLRDNYPVPVYRRYFAGGSTGNRGWHSRTLSAQGDVAAQNGGNALIETSLELRWKMFPGAKRWWLVEPDNIWLVLFSDAGNLWSAPRTVRVSEIAVSFGVGLRYNLFVGPIRIDYAMRLYNPTASEDPWITERRFWRDVFTKGLIHFGIGHAF
jgi:outer membrane protein insertion porin family